MGFPFTTPWPKLFWGEIAVLFPQPQWHLPYATSVGLVMEENKIAAFRASWGRRALYRSVSLRASGAGLPSAYFCILGTAPEGTGFAAAICEYIGNMIGS